ncbi:hypothetical protein EVAR_41220_1 [Eumeta japonica]|uniref:Uncharacterized protein n=1 Tax=Eumeta variegata TaxID=151549 RepID=A0A4C1W5W5_EUMVA|nr:hypothetical protein EVAR_41220_1 [Eumeta japonica]
MQIVCNSSFTAEVSYHNRPFTISEKRAKNLSGFRCYSSKEAREIFSLLISLFCGPPVDENAASPPRSRRPAAGDVLCELSSSILYDRVLQVKRILREGELLSGREWNQCNNLAYPLVEDIQRQP